MISTRYARAIYEYASEQGSEAILHEELRVLVNSFAMYPAMRKVMDNPIVPHELKVKLLTAASGIQVHETLKQVFLTVVGRGRSDYMENIALMYDEIYRNVKGIITAQLTTVEPADEQMKKALARLISAATTQQVEFQTKTDPDIIGGFVLEIGDQRLDASVKEQLRIIGYGL
ncbi:MAG: F0F1 ATP synthase subunit delta [Dysgonamonadaceae bacterium]|jgi:F-type H+-transporting ATPase subunit delta|nr:F0F1 ATP synthase subunit delta [Dysgonamonadaceae bacterium]